MEEGEICAEVSRDGTMGNDNYGGVESKGDSGLIVNQMELKEAWNDEVRSEVLNPTIPAKENACSSQDITSGLADMASCSQMGCHEAASSCTRNLSPEDTMTEASCGDKNTYSSHAENFRDDTASQITLEIPEHLSSTGVRKITFKFRKRKDDYEIQSHVSLSEPICNNEAINYFRSGDRSGIRNHHRHHKLYADDMDLKMPKKVTPFDWPTNVKKLLSTGILDGAAVKYMSESSSELRGIVSSGGYLCGCSSCLLSKVVSAYEFEKHAGMKSKHPNNHIFLENGKPIYSIIQEIKNAPLSQLDKVVRDAAGSAINEDSFQVWKASLQQSNNICGEDKYSSSLPTSPHPLGSSQVSEESVCVTSASLTLSSSLPKGIYMENMKAQKRVVKRRRHSNSSSDEQLKSTGGDLKKRDNNLHRRLFMKDGLPDGAELAYCVKGETLLEGYKKGNGIVCRCCQQMMSPSHFEAHAGMAIRRQPYRHIYTSSGHTLHDIAVSLSNGQKLTSENSTDSERCSCCGGPQNLICCNGCPKAFHAECLRLVALPEGNWLCPYCVDKSSSGRKSFGEESLNVANPIVIRLTKAVKVHDPEIGGCVICRSRDFSSAKFGDRTIILCEQCEKEHHVGCLRISQGYQLKSIPKGAWFCSSECKKIRSVLETSISTELNEIPSSALDTINRKLIEKGLIIDGTANNVQFRIIRGKGHYAHDDSLLGDACAIFHESFGPIKVKSGRDLVPIMVGGRKIYSQDFRGMYCVVLTVSSVVVSAGLLRVFGREVAELPLVSTTQQHQGKGYFQALYACIESLLSFMGVSNIVLPATGEAEPIWMNKFGFKKMSKEQLLGYQRDFMLVVFNGTTMLEKEVKRSANDEGSSLTTYNNMSKMVP